MMTAILPRQHVETTSFEDELIPICWNKRADINTVRDEVIDSDLGIVQSGPRKMMVDALVGIIKQAKDTICVSSFVIQESVITEALLAAASRGVRVYLLTASEKHFTRDIIAMSDFDEKIYKEHIALLDKLAGKILVRTAGHFHAKFILCDPHSHALKGYLLTANLTLGALYEPVYHDGRKYGPNFELGIKLTPKQIRGLYSQFIKGFWEEAEHELFEAKKLSGAGASPFGALSAPNDVLYTIGTRSTLKSEIMRMLDSATSYIIISAWSFQHDHETVRKLIERTKGGIKVFLLARSHQNNTKALTELRKHGATIVGHPRLHAKFIIVDGEEGLVMTANFSSLGLNSGFESGLLLDKAQIVQISGVHEIWSQCCEWSLELDLKRRDAAEEILVESKEGLKRVHIEKEYHENKTINATDFKEFLKPKFKKPVPPGDSLYLSGKCTYTVKPPFLPSGAKPIIEDNLPKGKKEQEKVRAIKDTMKRYPLFKKKNEAYLVVSEQEDITKALEIASHIKFHVVAREEEVNMK